jgi:hypothetical protein
LTFPAIFSYYVCGLDTHGEYKMSMTESFKRKAVGTGGALLTAASIWMAATATEEKPTNLLAIPVAVAGVSSILYWALGRPGDMEEPGVAHARTDGPPPPIV